MREASDSCAGCRRSRMMARSPVAKSCSEVVQNWSSEDLRKRTWAGSRRPALSPAFGGDAQLADAFFQVVPISTSEPWTRADTELAHRFWNDHQLRRRTTHQPRRPVADILIAAFASRFQGIITRNAADFRHPGSGLKIVEP